MGKAVKYIGRVPISISYIGELSRKAWYSALPMMSIMRNDKPNTTRFAVIRKMKIAKKKRENVRFACIDARSSNFP
jgi:prephenate dehydratase